eukprot:scaffold7222_cov535-Prasinococcus_capsulatus_cf.AAC.4
MRTGAAPLNNNIIISSARAGTWWPGRGAQGAQSLAAAMRRAGRLAGRAARRVLWEQCRCWSGGVKHLSGRPQTSSTGRAHGVRSTEDSAAATKTPNAMSAGAGVGFSDARTDDYGCHVRPTIKYAQTCVGHPLATLRLIGRCGLIARKMQEPKYLYTKSHIEKLQTELARPLVGLGHHSTELSLPYSSHTCCRQARVPTSHACFVEA